jgi:hypothetical protein
MKCTLWIALGLTAAAGVVAVVLLAGEARPSGSADRIPSGGAQQQRDVRVRHEFVTVAAPVISQVEARPVARTPGSGRPITAPRGRAPLDKPPFSMTRRVLLGDGRHRPEPFPTVR